MHQSKGVVALTTPESVPSIFLIGEKSSGKTQTILSYNHTFEFNRRISYLIYELSRHLLGYNAGSISKIQPKDFEKLCKKFLKTWKRKKEKCLTFQVFKRNLNLFEIEIERILEIIEKIVKNKFIIELNDSEFEILEQCELLSHPFAYHLESWSIRSLDNELTELCSVPYSKLLSIFENRKNSTLLFYISLISWMDEFYSAYDSEETFERVLLSDKKLEFVFTYPDLLMKALKKGEKYGDVSETTRMDLLEIDTSYGFDRVLSSIISKYETKYQSVRVDKPFNYHIARANSFNEISKVIQSAASPDFSQFISPHIIRKTLFKNSGAIPSSFTDLLFE